MSIESSTVVNGSERLSRDDWLKAALHRSALGIDAVKVAPLAAELGVTTGSFYWHFKNRRELLDALLDYWEREMTDVAIKALREFTGSPSDRILRLMESVASGNLARYDLPIWAWAQSDSQVAQAFARVLRKRFTFTASLYSEAGFSKEQAEARARMLVVYMMGEATLIPSSLAKRKQLMKLQHDVLMAPEQASPRRTKTTSA